MPKRYTVAPHDRLFVQARLGRRRRAASECAGVRVKPHDGATTFNLVGIGYQVTFRFGEDSAGGTS